ncbi:hypothetical protein RND71_017174 [Anisodus tanguticus]|uniref:Uncharacterized protein n=1 Tax=Anisodus tanguticus TaxID=243964 RepID=A0AAE1S1S4_9SOLA|nr:hypothetical protein RND71_017174 [Anisodus tanguticus]
MAMHNSSPNTALTALTVHREKGSKREDGVNEVKAYGLSVIGNACRAVNAAFSDCYTRCFIFCMIDPSQTMVKRWMTVLDPAQETAPRATSRH